MVMVVFCLLPEFIFSQADSTSYQICRHYSNKIFTAEEDFIRFAYSDSLKNQLDDFLSSAGGLEYKFDSLPGFSELRSSDSNIIIITWFIQRTDGTYEYNGCIIRRDNGGNKPSLIWLEDQSASIIDAETKILKAPEWYGCLYYDIITDKKGSLQYYTLLGWDGNDGISKKKIIEILSFKSNGQAIFGASVFMGYNNKARRVIFEYSAKANFLLRYDKQILVSKQRKGKNVQIKEEKADMIVFDHLQPSNPNVEGQFQFYIPETNVLNGFIQINKKWKFVRDVDSRNPPANKKRKFRKPQMGLFQP